MQGETRAANRHPAATEFIENVRSARQFMNDNRKLGNAG
jgi:hypothetical protein